MSSVGDANLSAIEQLRRRIGRAAFALVVAGLGLGMVFYALHQGPASSWVLAATVGVLLALPVVTVLAVLAEEIRQRDWGFAWLAVAVLGLLGYAVISKVLVALSHKEL